MQGAQACGQPSRRRAGMFWFLGVFRVFIFARPEHLGKKKKRRRFNGGAATSSLAIFSQPKSYRTVQRNRSLHHAESQSVTTFPMCLSTFGSSKHLRALKHHSSSVAEAFPAHIIRQTLVRARCHLGRARSQRYGGGFAPQNRGKMSTEVLYPSLQRDVARPAEHRGKFLVLKTPVTRDWTEIPARGFAITAVSKILKLSPLVDQASLDRNNAADPLEHFEPVIRSVVERKAYDPRLPSIRVVSALHTGAPSWATSPF